MNVAKYKIILFIIIFSPFLAALQTNAQPRLKSVYPYLVLNQLQVQWDAVVGMVAEEYQYRKKENNGAYGAWVSAGLNTLIIESALTEASTYTYQVRVRVAGVWSGASNEKSNGFLKVWPVGKASDCTTESVEMLHGFNQPIQVGTTNYFHEGIDIQGESLVDNECVKAPVGGIVISHGGTDPNNLLVDLQVYINGGTKYIQFNHLRSIGSNVIDGESVAVGESLGLIGNGRWNTLTSHTHCHHWIDYFDFTTTVNPFSIWDANNHRDPQESSPLLLDGNGDGEALRLRKTPVSTDYFTNSKVHNGVDIVVEAVDEQSSNAPWQIPKEVGYYIEKQNNGSWVDIVKTSATPYVLVDNSIYYLSEYDNPNTGVVNTIIDYRDHLKSIAPNTPSGSAGYEFNQWFTYRVTNTTGTTGAIADLDSAQCWATDARKTVAPDNGYVTNYDKARAIDEAKFPDGSYRINIRLKDFVNTAPDFQKEVKVDNFRPYVKKVQIKGGELEYNASFAWNDGTGQLDFTDNTDTDKACGKVTVTITTSESMKDVKIEIVSLSFTKISTTPKAGTDRKEWEFEIPEGITKDAVEGPHRVLIDGHDIDDNLLQGFTAKSNVPGAQLQKRRLDETWDPAVTPVRDNIHEFKLLSFKDKIVVATTGITSCEKSDGKAMISVQGVTGNFEYAVDDGPYQASGAFTGLTEGPHVAYVRSTIGGCKFSKDFTIADAPNAIKLNVSGFGVRQIPCRRTQPNIITLSATATGGSGNYSFTPASSITVSSSGRHVFTVMDIVTGCTESLGGDVIFVPILCSVDPNDIIGPEGYGPGKMIAKSKQHSYMIRFENDPDFATGPAQIVKINQPLHTNVNPFSLRLGDFSFAGMTFTVPSDKTFYSARLNLVDSLGVVVDVTAGIDAVKREAFWIFESKDPVTGLPPADATLGFLPVNDSTAKGVGFVTYLIKAASHTQTGDTIYAKASIVFDANSAIETPLIFNTIDAVAPVSRIKPLSASIDTTKITLSWNGQDDNNGSGVRDYNVYVSENSAPFRIYLTGTTDTTTTFTGTRGSRYCFFTLANDNVGNQEPMKNGCEAVVQNSYDIVLPIQWLYFKGQQANSDAVLTWATIIESNTKNFVIERSLNGNQFSEVGKVAARGTSTVTNNYHFIDKDAASLQVKVVYYRLRQVDVDGKFTYSVVVAIPFRQDNRDLIVKAFPNPFQQIITLQILNVTTTKENDHVSLYTLDGKQLYSRKLIIKGNTTVLLQDMPDFGQGVYLLKVSVNEKLFTIKMLKE